MALTDDEQTELRNRFRHHWEHAVPFNVFAKMRIERWEPDGITCFVPLQRDLTAHEGIWHGGVVGALIDSCATGSVMAGHDFDLGSRPATVTMSVQYLGTAAGQGARVEGRCVRRGKVMQFAEASVYSDESGKLLATGQVTVQMTGRHVLLG